jgi:hypothetical protein
MAEVTIADVDQAEAALADAKARREAGEDVPEYRDVKREAVRARRDWRLQEEAAGRRTGRIGGDAYQSGG